MQENVGGMDRTLRLFSGPVMIGLGYGLLGGGEGRPAGLATMLAGAVILESGITAVCPVSHVLGIDTSR